jgi:biopolymer transport protein ExbB
VSLRQIIEANGPVFLIIFGLLSLASLTIIVWRLWLNFSAKTNLGEFLEQFREELGRGGREAALEFCESEPGLVPKLFAVTLQTCDQGKVATRNAMANTIELEMLPELNFLLPLMLVFAKLAPMIGLLGTVSGMILAFGKIAGATKVDPSVLADDIGMALFTTAEGLIIAIPLIFAYSMFRERVNRFELELQRAAQAALNLLPAMARPSGPSS